MKNKTFVIFAQSSDGSGTTGLTPSWVGLYDIDAANGANEPTITEVGSGFYKFAVDFSNYTNLAGVIDMGATATTRYLWVVLSADEQTVQPYLSDRILSV